MTESRSWRPLLQGADAETARRRIQTIAEQLPSVRAASHKRREDGAQMVRSEQGVGSGGPGEALFWTYYGVTQDDEAAADQAISCLDSAVEKLAEQLSNATLYGGFAGTAWVAQHLEGLLFEEDEDDGNADIDEALLTFLDHKPWRLDYDLISGLVGLGVYGLERRNAPTGEPILERVLDHLEEMSQTEDGGITWFTKPDLLPEHQRVLFPEGYYNLGVAHGVPGVIGLLGHIAAAGLSVSERARRMLDASVAWLLNRRHQGDDWSFSSMTAPGAEPERCRLAWCYGDPGVAATLVLAGKQAGNPNWVQAGLEVAHGCARRPKDDAGIRDCGLCHGALGLAHIFNRLYQATGDEVCRDTALDWYRYALEWVPEKGPEEGEWRSGFPSLEPISAEEIELREEHGFLTGISGCGVALLAAVTDLEPRWDRLLLVDVPLG